MPPVGVAVRRRRSPLLDVQLFLPSRFMTKMSFHVREGDAPFGPNDVEPLAGRPMRQPLPPPSRSSCRCRRLALQRKRDRRTVWSCCVEELTPPVILLRIGTVALHHEDLVAAPVRAEEVIFMSLQRGRRTPADLGQFCSPGAVASTT